ncbi:oligosaccharide repeat unit polymerase [Flavobacteriaceae bacterium]|nr:oligosaccharide repeat unit polymerase [Flavobacteriaceae bacterium]
MILKLLFFTLAIGTLLVFYVNNKKLLSPTLILFAMFTLSIFFLIINRDFSLLEISLKTYLVIITSLVAWGFGEILSISVYSKKKKPILSLAPKYMILPSNRILFISCLIIFGVAVSEYYRFVNIGKSLGGDNIVSYYILVRDHVVGLQNNNIQANKFSATRTIVALITLARIITYYFIVIFIFNKYFHNIKKYKYLIPIVFLFPILFFTTSRSSFLELFSFVFLTTLLIRSQSKGWGVGSLKILRKMLVPLLILIIAFFAIGFIRSNGIGTMISRDMFNNMSKYFGSSIIGLDILLNSRIDFSGNIAEHTIPILYAFFKKIGFVFDTLPLHSDFFYLGNGQSSNIYTALRKPILDFGILGMLATRVCMGFIYGLIYRYYINNVNNPYSIKAFVIFPLLYFPIVMYIFSDLFYYFTKFDFFETLLYLVIIDKLIIKRSLVFNVKTEI